MDERSSMGAIGISTTIHNIRPQTRCAMPRRMTAVPGNMMGMMVGGQLAGGVGGALHQQQQAPPAAPRQVPQQSQFFAVLDGNKPVVYD